MVLGFFPLVLDDHYLDSGLIEYGNPYQSTRSYNVPKQTTNLIWYPLGLSIRIFLLVNQPVAVLTVSISPTNQFHEIQYGNETWQWKITKFDDFPISSAHWVQGFPCHVWWHWIRSFQVNYMEFCQHLSAFNKRDPLMIQQLIKYSVMELRSVLKQDVMEAGQLDQGRFGRPSELPRLEQGSECWPGKRRFVWKWGMPSKWHLIRTNDVVRHEIWRVPYPYVPPLRSAGIAEAEWDVGGPTSSNLGGNHQYCQCPSIGDPCTVYSQGQATFDSIAMISVWMCMKNSKHTQLDVKLIEGHACTAHIHTYTCIYIYIYLSIYLSIYL